LENNLNPPKDCVFRGIDPSQHEVPFTVALLRHGNKPKPTFLFENARGEMLSEMMGPPRIGDYVCSCLLMFFDALERHHLGTHLSISQNSPPSLGDENTRKYRA